MKSFVSRALLVFSSPAVFVALLLGVSFPFCEATAAATDISKSDVVAANVDHSVDPGVDFFEFANGVWLKAHPIPATRGAWGIGDVVRDELYERLRKVCEAAAQRSWPFDSAKQKIGIFWLTGMNEELAEREGLAPLKSYLARIAATKDVSGVLDVAFELRRLDVDVLFDVQVWQDERASDVVAIHLSQGGLGLPDRDYYFKDEPSIVQIRTAYVRHLRRVFSLLGDDRDAAAKNAKQVMDFETALANVSRDIADRRDPIKNYNKMALADLRRNYTKTIDWTQQLRRWNVSPSDVIVGQPEFFAGLEIQLKRTPVPVLRNYLRARTADRFSAFLSKNFSAEHFDFFGRTLNGEREQEPRWKRVLDAENGALGMVLGRLFVDEFFPEAARKRYSSMVEAVRTAFGERIDRLDWMSKATKVKARDKLATVAKKVGYPSIWKDYSSLAVDHRSFGANVIAAARWKFDDKLSKLGRPIDRDEWFMTPQSYDAYYYESNNEIVLPAAIFTIPGFADAELDDAVVYGYAAASTIGHEMTHGFDDEGRQFDAAGNLTDWWTKDDAEEFRKRADAMVKQFDSYEPLSGLHINGRAALGENIADYGGLLIGLDAFKKTEQYKRGEKIAGYTPVQRFFLGYALSWMVEMSDPMLQRSLLSDVHAPAKWRVNGPLSNMPDFWAAFDVKPGQPMRRGSSERIAIW